MENKLLPEQIARIKIDAQLKEAGWDIVNREEYIPNHAEAVKEALMAGATESDYLLFIDNKAIAVIEAKREENPLGEDVVLQAENYANIFNSIEFFKNLGGYEKVTKTYTINGYIPTMLTSISPDKQTKIIRKFAFVR